MHLPLSEQPSTPVYQQLRSTLPEHIEVVQSSSLDVDVLPAGISKRTPVELLPFCKEEIWAFGDGRNDLELFDAAGLCVAMENAIPELKEKADCVIGPHDSDAIADFIDALCVEGSTVVFTPN
eukprot:TRINITY_DN44812_c0_g1_i1.p2 TRINITY_DN44812_c0_g1~~TRINITY_DN44812_c0_g1_i1.p2  ORF type:complete len:123 (+),score=22.63 TRINITY_DN44812_c0_g1_i1:558-926(+)